MTRNEAAETLRQTAVGGINLDDTRPEDLEAFSAAVHSLRLERAARIIFPDAEPKAARFSVARLAGYASLKAWAMVARSSGFLADAEALEASCDTIYSSLPKFARW